MKKRCFRLKEEICNAHKQQKLVFIWSSTNKHKNIQLDRNMGKYT